jgi:selenocysteine lyase/cysteine desulfurase
MSSALDVTAVRARIPALASGVAFFDDRDAADAYAFLAQRGVNAPAGSFYALEASRRLGLGDGDGLRIGLAPYTDAGDVQRLLAGLAAFLGD